MGFLAPAEMVVARAAAAVMMPPPPPDITKWCEENIVFDERSPMPGPFNIGRFAFLREIHEALSPEHPSREVTIRGSAQWGKTASIIQPTLGTWHASMPLDSLVVHPTLSAAAEWVDNKWLPMRRQAPSLKSLFGSGTDNKDAKFNQETLSRTGSLKIASAGSPADLTGTTRRLVVMDDLSKFEMSDKGDPEAMAISRASGFDDAKILRVSTPMVKGTCRITRSYDRSDQRLYYVPCPHCDNKAPLTWDNFKANIDPERLHAAHFTCEACGCVIEHSHKEAMVAAGQWVAQNAGGDHPGFHLWRAYAPQRDWASIAVEYAQVMGWSALRGSTSPEEELHEQIEAETEQTFFNDVLGLPYEQASGGPDWQALRDRVENAPVDQGSVLPRGILPASGVLVMAGVDCQLDRIEVQIVAFGRNYQRWAIDHLVIPHHIGDKEGRAALDAILKATWRTELGLHLGIDMMAVDVGTYTEDVWSWAKRHPWSRVILVKGASTQSGPILLPMKFERRQDGHARRRQRRAFMLNVSQLKADFYTWLAKDDPQEHGYVAFARGLGDEYYRQVTSEVRVLNRARSGVVTSSWQLAEPGRRNEVLDTMNYAEAAARRKGWASMTEAQWDDLFAARSIAPPDDQPDLFDASMNVVPASPPNDAPSDSGAPQKTAPNSWLGPRNGKWF